MSDWDDGDVEWPDGDDDDYEDQLGMWPEEEDEEEENDD